ncbi:MAG TPA: peptidase M28, partial [Chitinophagaceae bacterium]|nr:peptidase M28 [Chitinophagaceae bacterium]
MRTLCTILFAFISISLFAQNDAPDMAAINKIKKEGLDNSKVMDIAFHLTDVSGPRLTNSPGYNRAANWAVAELTKMGLKNARLEPWGDFGKGWEQLKCYVAMRSPYYVPLIAQPLAWTGSTPGNGEISGEVVLIKATDTTELEKYAGKLKGKIVMQWSDAELKPSFEADGNRFSAEQLDKMANADAGPSQGGQRPQMDQAARDERIRQFRIQRRVREMISEEQPALILTINGRGNDGTIFTSSGGSYAKDAAVPSASVMLSSDDFLRIQRLANAGEKVVIEADVKTRILDEDTKGYNVIAEIPGSDPKL